MSSIMNRLLQGLRRTHVAVVFAVLLAGLLLAVQIATAGSVNSGASHLVAAPASVTPTICSQWEVVPSPNNGSGANTLYGISALAPDDIWAVGNYTGASNEEQTLVQRWNGTQWNLVSSPSPGYDSKLLAVSALSPNNVWAVGTYREANSLGSPSRTLVEHWDGVQWTIIPSPNVGSDNNRLTGVVALAPNDVWAVGISANASNYPQTLTLHWNGSQWVVVPSPNITGGDTYLNYLEDVTAIAPDDIWAVGYYRNIMASVYHSLTLHWDGMQWTIMTRPANEPGFSFLYGVSSTSPTDVWAVGYSSFPQRTLIQHWNGTQWSIVPSPNPPDGNGALNGVYALSPTSVWAVGRTTSGTSTRTLIQHWNGTQWSIVPSPNPAGTTSYDLNSIYRVAATSDVDVWSVGVFRDYDAGNIAGTLVERYNPGCATPTATPTNTVLPTTTPSATPSGCAIRFADVPPDHTFYPHVRCLACRGSISGYECGAPGEPCDPNNTPYFRPHSHVIRGQIAKMVSQSAGFQDPPGDQIYEDVPPTNPFYEYVQRLTHLEVMSGYPCGRLEEEPCREPLNRPYFRPNAFATRSQISKIVSNAAQFNETPPAQIFEDVSSESGFYVWVQRLASRGIMGGYPCGLLPEEPCVEPANRPYFRPANTTTRGQASKIVANTFYPECQAR